MRIESCRSCGTEMVPCKTCEKCPICQKPMKLFCPGCNSTGENQVHQHLSGIVS